MKQTTSHICMHRSNSAEQGLDFIMKCVAASDGPTSDFYFISKHVCVQIHLI